MSNSSTIYLCFQGIPFLCQSICSLLQFSNNKRIYCKQHHLCLLLFISFTMVEQEMDTVNLLDPQQHQPSYDDDVDADKDDILSLRDLPLTTSSRNWTKPDRDPVADHHQEDGFEFFSGEFNPYSFSHAEEQEEEGDIIFCGKIIPYRASKSENSNSNFRGRSSSLNKPRGATAVSSLYGRDYSTTHHHQVKRFWSLPVSAAASNGLRDSLRSSDSPAKRLAPTSKSRWYVLAFGVEKIPVKMELHDMKLRQSKNFNGQMFQPNQQVVKQSSNTSRKGSLWGFLGILGCNREEASNMVKASFVCIPNV